MNFLKKGSGHHGDHGHGGHHGGHGKQGKKDGEYFVYNQNIFKDIINYDKCEIIRKYGQARNEESNESGQDEG